MLSDEPPPREPGQRIGPYRLIKELGRGGMGVVWLAERADGQHSRQVALKMPLVENLNWLLAARFARERNILASLEHPGIARLYDAGVDPVGRNAQPYIAIEYVAGVPITTYVREHKLKPEAAVLLFIRVIEAVAHAHAQLVIHRDIKPSNILVDGKGDPHLLDFGIAKLLDDEDTLSADATQLTRLSGRALTLDYASPEQINSAPLGVASDVYALGVVLYELLTGSRPYHPKGPTRRDLELAILEQEPSRPSDHLLTSGNSESSRTARRLRGDLDTIVLKALRKDARLRYASAQAFADDLKRYLSYQPIQARPDGALYRIAKFVRRQRVPLLIAAVSIATVAIMVGRVWQQQQLAFQSRQQFEAIDGLMQSVFSSINPAVDANQSFTAAEVLQRTQRYVGTLVNVSPQLQRDLTLRIAELYRQTANYDQAIALADSVISSTAPVSDARTIALAWVISARAATFKRDFDDAQRRLVQLRALLTTSVPEPDELYAQMANAEGNLANAVDRARDGLARFTEGLRYLAATGQPNELLRAWLIEGQGHAALGTGDLMAARGFLNAAGAIYRSLPIAIGEREFELFEPLSRVENGLGRSDVALTMIGRALPEMMARRGLNHPLTLLLLRNQAVALTRLGRFAEAEPVLQALRESPPPYRQRERLYVDLIAATTLLHRGLPDAAAAALRDVIAQLPAGTQGTSRVQRIYGAALLSAGQLTASGDVLRAAEQFQRTELGQDHPDVLMTSVLLANWRIRSGDREGARSMLARVVPALRTTRGDAHPLTLVAMSYLALLDSGGALGINGGVSADVLGQRVATELGWQAGALELASWLRKGSPITEDEWLRLPVVF